MTGGLGAYPLSAMKLLQRAGGRLEPSNICKLRPRPPLAWPWATWGWNALQLPLQVQLLLQVTLGPGAGEASDKARPTLH